MPTLKFTVSRGRYAGVHPSDTEIPARQPEVEQASFVELLSKRFPNLPAGEAWIIVARYFNKTAEKPAIVPRKRPSP